MMQGQTMERPTDKQAKEAEMMKDRILTGEAQEAQEAGEITAQELGAGMAQGEAQQDAQAQQEERMSEIREGIGELFEDGWSAQELAALSQDETAREAIAAGKSVARAACAYLRAKGTAKKHGVALARTIAADDHAQGRAIEGMTDEEFDAFSRKARAAMMSGKKVRI